MADNPAQVFTGTGYHQFAPIKASDLNVIDDNEHWGVELQNQQQYGFPAMMNAANYAWENGIGDGSIRLKIKSGDKEGTLLTYRRQGDYWVPTVSGTQYWDTNNSGNNMGLLSVLGAAGLGVAGAEGLLGQGVQGAFAGAAPNPSLAWASGGAIPGLEAGSGLIGGAYGAGAGAVGGAGGAGGGAAGTVGQGLPANLGGVEGIINGGATTAPGIDVGLGTGFAGVAPTTGTLPSIVPGAVTGTGAAGIGAFTGLGVPSIGIPNVYGPTTSMPAIPGMPGSGYPPGAPGTPPPPGSPPSSPGSPSPGPTPPGPNPGPQGNDWGLLGDIGKFLKDNPWLAGLLGAGLGAADGSKVEDLYGGRKMAIDRLNANKMPKSPWGPQGY